MKSRERKNKLMILNTLRTMAQSIGIQITAEGKSDNTRMTALLVKANQRTIEEVGHMRGILSANKAKATKKCIAKDIARNLIFLKAPVLHLQRRCQRRRKSPEEWKRVLVPAADTKIDSVLMIGVT